MSVTFNKDLGPGKVIRVIKECTGTVSHLVMYFFPTPSAFGLFVSSEMQPRRQKDVPECPALFEDLYQKWLTGT